MCHCSVKLHLLLIRTARPFFEDCTVFPDAMLVLPRVLSVLANLFMVYFESVFLSSIWLRSPDDIFALQPLDFPLFWDFLAELNFISPSV